MTIIIGICGFALGTGLGFFLSEKAYEHQDWTVMKWCESALGFRPVMIGTKLHVGDRIVMALPVDDSGFPDEGATVE